MVLVNYIELPIDTGNAGKLVRTNERNVTLSTGATANVEEHVNIFVGINSGNLAEVNSANQVNVTGRSASGLTANAPGSSSVGTSTTSVLGGNSSRTGFVCTNLSSNNIFLGLANNAVLNQGIALLPGSSFAMDEYTYSKGTINAIASTAGSTLSYMEFQ